MFENYPPIEDGFIRCTTVQSEATLAKLLAEGIYQPSRLETDAHSKETSDCTACDDPIQWCRSDAYTWMYEQCALRLDLPEMESGVWLFAHNDVNRNLQEAYNHWLDKEGMVFLVLDVPMDRIVQSDMLLFEQIMCNDPVRSLESLSVNCELPENKHLFENWISWYNDSSISNEDREKRKRESWQNIFNSDRWEDGMYCDYCGNDQSSVVQGVAPFICMDYLVDIIFPSVEGTWDFLRPDETLRVYGRKGGLSVLFLRESGITSKRIGVQSTASIYGHQKPSTLRKYNKGEVHRKKYKTNKKGNSHLIIRTGNNSRDANLIIGNMNHRRE